MKHYGQKKRYPWNVYQNDFLCQTLNHSIHSCYHFFWKAMFLSTLKTLMSEPLLSPLDRKSDFLTKRFYSHKQMNLHMIGPWHRSSVLPSRCRCCQGSGGADGLPRIQGHMLRHGAPMPETENLGKKKKEVKSQAHPANILLKYSLFEDWDGPDRQGQCLPVRSWVTMIIQLSTRIAR